MSSQQIYPASQSWSSWRPNHDLYTLLTENMEMADTEKKTRPHVAIHERALVSKQNLWLTTREEAQYAYYVCQVRIEQVQRFKYLESVLTADVKIWQLFWR